MIPPSQWEQQSTPAQKFFFHNSKKTFHLQGFTKIFPALAKLFFHKKIGKKEHGATDHNGGDA